ncbi:DUF4194 domain-containing protein [Orrella sp. 11846]|uniref:DUF4194 domain-containing protein n=1 Tax=Orrella sp. 11846 TaxID=3409913 RepID=UPI003B5AE7E2
MSWSEEDENVAQEGEAAQTDTDVLFVGDYGELALETRRVLVQLLAGPSLDARRHSKLWPILVRDEIAVRRFLAELFLELVVDLDMQVAFTRQADTGELDVPILLRRVQLTFIDSILLLYLRQRLTQAESQGDRAVVSTEEITEFLSLYERAASTDRAGFVKRVHASIEKIKKHSILQKIRASDDRFEVSPTLKLLFSAEEIQGLTRLYQQMIDDDVPLQTPQLAVDSGTDEEEIEP